jgi:AraC-like DNA-binding protein
LLSIKYEERKPDKDISEFVERFWLLENLSDEEKELMVIPDGRVDVFFTCSASKPFHIVLMGLEAHPAKRMLKARTKIFAISLNLLAVEYLLKEKIADFVNGAKPLNIGFWGISEKDLADFNSFCAKATAAIKGQLNFKVDNRKRKLFELIYSPSGTYSVERLSQSVFWNSRQINRYFSQQFGMPLKTYCNILRFKASLSHLKNGRLYPENDFTDQAHFIKNVKKFAGVVPTELSKNKNDRFIQLSVLSKP